ncbi:hypothetical protein, partial [Azospirillum lipoferum]|uniref:hypothetical protein n=2 Tax=Azospirillum lipoferum TaxID=193 RepID=UPI00361ACA66
MTGNLFPSLLGPGNPGQPPGQMSAPKFFAEGRKKYLRGLGGVAYKAPPDANDAGAAEPAATDP